MFAKLQVIFVFTGIFTLRRESFYFGSTDPICRWASKRSPGYRCPKSRIPQEFSVPGGVSIGIDRDHRVINLNALSRVWPGSYIGADLQPSLIN
jgi:hypothetical protein